VQSQSGDFKEQSKIEIAIAIQSQQDAGYLTFRKGEKILLDRSEKCEDGFVFGRIGQREGLFALNLVRVEEYTL
jgi:hypothetical protein